MTNNRKIQSHMHEDNKKTEACFYNFSLRHTSQCQELLPRATPQVAISLRNPCLHCRQDRSPSMFLVGLRIKTLLYTSVEIK